MRRDFVTACVSICWSLALSLICGGAVAGATRDSGYYGESLAQYTTAWIDDKRLLFISSGRDSVTAKRALYIWNLEVDAITKYAELGQSAGMCFAEGFIRYWYARDVSIIERAGRFGEEKEQVFNAGDWPAKKGLRLNRLTCRYFRDGDLPNTETIVFRPLREGDGYVGNGVAPKSNETFFLPNESAQAVGLKSPTRAVELAYSVYGRAYVLREAPAIIVRSKETSVRFWIFRPPNDLHSVSIPPGPWLGGSIAAVEPAAGGIAFTSHASGKPDKDGRPTTGAGGLYLLINREAKRLIPGYPFGMSVSPNGCEVAVNIVPRAAAGLPSTIRIAHLCIGQSK